MKTNTPELFDRELFARVLAECNETKTLSEAATATGISAATLSRLERGRVPSLQVFFAVCSLLDISPAAFMRGASADGQCLRCAVQMSRLERIAAIAKEGSS